MSDPPSPCEPLRPADIARLELSKVRIEDGVPLADFFRRATEAAAEVVGVERAGVWLFDDDRQSLRCADLFEASKHAHTSGVTLRVADFPDYFEALGRRKSVPAEVAVEDPRTNCLADAYLVPLGITSLLDAPIYVAGEVVGVVCHEHTGPVREWTTEHRDFAGSLADILALKIRAAEMIDARIALQTRAAHHAETRRLTALAGLAAGVAHDFNNILTIVIGSAELLTMDPRNPDAVAETARQIIAAAQRGVALSAQMMAYARPGPHSARVVRPADIVAAETPLLRATAGDACPLTVDVRAATGRVLIAADQFLRVLLNLVGNARDATPDGGPIVVRVDDADDTFPDGLAGRFVVVEVADRGTGIAAADVGRIFDPYFTTKPRGKGTGLGLAIVSQIVDHAGGFVRVATAVGAGTTFRVFLPRVTSQG